jgi:phage replication-related protein YjqB (UPF0714/DUF867 family)
MDNYRHFEQLREFEKEGVDFRIRRRIENSGIAILSIHGSDLEMQNGNITIIPLRILIKPAGQPGI